MFNMWIKNWQAASLLYRMYQKITEETKIEERWAVLSQWRQSDGGVGSYFCKNVGTVLKCKFTQMLASCC